jgi:hypothetical protein
LIRRLFLAVLVTALPLLAVVATDATIATPAAAASMPVAAYWLVASDGGIFSFGGAPFYGSTGGIVLNKPIVGMTAVGSPSSPLNGKGYWLIASDGGVFSYGDAQFYGSTGSMTLNKPIVGMTSTPDGKGYWLVASDGGIFSYGDAQFYGSTGAIRLNQPVVGMASTPDGKGYWLVASDGGIFSYGDAQFYGSTGSIVLNKPIVGMIANPNGNGYFLLASDGGIFSYNAPFFGSLGGLPLKHPVVAGTASPDGGGYWFTDSSGLVSNFGDAHYFGSAPSPLNKPIVGMADAPGNGSFVGGTYPSGSYGYDISYAQCGNFPAGDHQIGIVQVGQVNGTSLTNPNPCLTQEAAWAGGGLNLYVYLGYGTSSTNEPGCNGDVSCNAGYQAGLAAYAGASGAGAGSTTIPWWLDVETYAANWSANLSENAQYVQGVLNALHETEGIPDVGIYASPGVWNNIVGSYQPDVPYWMADYLSSPSGPGSCADIGRWRSTGALLPSGPLEVVQYFSGPVPGSPGNYDDDYAC